MRNLLLGAVLGLGFGIVLAGVLLSGPSMRLAQHDTLPYSRFITDLNDGKIEEVTFQGTKILSSPRSPHYAAHRWTVAEISENAAVPALRVHDHPSSSWYHVSSGSAIR
jgi:FtsH Extracellular